MPFFPSHWTVCGGRSCRPGEGNLRHVREQTRKGWRYKQWTQPYIHREAWVQTRSREQPHGPDPGTTYASLVGVARRVAVDGLVVVTAGDFDYRELVLNWVRHARKLRWSNTLVLAMDHPLYEELERQGIAASNHAELLNAWNNTCLQRYIQRVRMERHLAVAALLAAGIDVLHMDATCIAVRDFLPYLRGVPNVDVLVQRDAWPSDPVRKVGTAANAGLYYVRARRGQPVVDMLTSVVDRGLIEFYLRWNNIPDQYGLSFVLSGLRLDERTSPTSNETTTGVLHPPGSHCAKRGGCLTAGFLPYDRFPRTGPWAELQPKAEVYHLTYGCMQEEAPCSVAGVRPFRGHRQRLDRYDDVDFEDQAATLRQLGLWLV